jgi:molybdopterin-guanine dinucleotide biosynthesis protein A
VPRANRTAAIIAGGQATRLSGRDKSRLVVDGRPIIVRQVEVLQSVAASTIVIGGPLGRYADLGLDVYPDLVPGCGALGGIYTAMATVSTPTVVVVACDLPFLEAALLTRLADLADAHDAAWVETARGPEPLIGCYRAAAAERVRQRLVAGHLKASDLSTVLDVATVGPDELATFGPPARLLANVNTPDDYAQVQYRLS